VAGSDVEHDATRGDQVEGSKKRAGDETNEHMSARRWWIMAEAVVKKAEGAEGADRHGGRIIAAGGALPAHFSLTRGGRIAFLAAALLLFLILQLAFVPVSYWEYDEPLFAAAIRSYQPLLHHPPPPGYPVYVGAGQLVDLLVRNRLQTLLAISFAASLAGFLFLILTIERITGRLDIALAGSLLFYLSPAMLVHSTLPISDPGGIALLIVAIWASLQLKGSSWRLLVFAVAAALAVGWRPQLSIFAAPLFFFGLFAVGGLRRVAVAISAFAITCAGWLLPLIHAAGGFGSWYRWIRGQAGYFAAHDAVLSRSGWEPLQTFFRFVAHPWGPKELAIPVLLLGLGGLIVLIVMRSRRELPIFLAGLIYLIFALMMMDPADGVRYSLPATLVMAILAALPLSLLRWPAVPVVVVAAWCVGAMLYVSPIIDARTHSPSPPVMAARTAHRVFDRQTTILYELSLRPHAELFLRSFRIEHVDAAFRRPLNEKDVWIIGDGASSHPEAMTFEWPESDAYGKLTRNHYRVVVLEPVPPEERFLIISGVHSLERTPLEGSWRWLSSTAEIEMPDIGLQHLRLLLDLPPEAPIEAAEVTLIAGRAVLGRYEVIRGRATEIEVRLPAGETRLLIESSSEFIPSEDDGPNRDPRRLAVRLRELSRR
jgi:hypothetical protein